MEARIAPAPVRKFTVADGMVLVAGTAVGIALVRPLQAAKAMMISYEGWIAKRIDDIQFYTYCLAASWAISLLVLRLRRPRPERRALFRQPGFTASVAVAMTAAYHAISLIVTILLLRFGSGRDYETWDLLAMNLDPKYCDNPGFIGLWFGPAVASVWLTQKMVGAWEPEPGWIDRAGRALGVFWIVSNLGFLLFFRMLLLFRIL